MADFSLTIFDTLISSIEEGSKTLDVRVGFSKIKRIQPGDRICFKSKSRTVVVVVTAIRAYLSFEQMLAEEDHTLIAPGMLKEQLLTALCQLYQHHEEQLGVYVVQFRRKDNGKSRSTK